MMKKLIMIASFLCFLPLGNAGFYGPLELGMSPSQTEQALGTYQGVVPPTQANVFGNETSAQLSFTTTKPYGAARCKLNMGFKNNGLYALTLESMEAFPSDKFDDKLKSRYKQFAMMHEQRFGKPVSVRAWPELNSVHMGNIYFLHIYQMSPEMLAYVGIGRSTDDTFSVVVRFLDAKAVPEKPSPPKGEVLQEWAAVAEFPELKEADAWVLKALEAMLAKKAKLAQEYFQNAASLGSSRGYWGLSLLLSGGKGISGDKALSEQYRLKAAGMCYALSMVEVDRNFTVAMQKLNMNASDAKAMIAAIHRAAAENVVSAQYNLGIMYKNGYGVAKDPAKSREYFQRAADAGDIQAAKALESAN